MKGLAERLDAWAVQYAGADATVPATWRMPGSSGLSFGFTLDDGSSARDLVLRLTPPGVSSRRNSDVLRQARLLEVLAADRLPVAEVLWQGGGDSVFGTPAYVVAWVQGHATNLFVPGRAETEDGADLAEVFDDAMRVLARIHQHDWRRDLADWSQPRPLAEQVAQWTPTLHKTPKADWIRQGEHVRERLLATLPANPTTTLVHGDYYSNNWLFEHGRLTAVVDWELAEIGAGALDVGWVCMMYDEASWSPARHRWQSWQPDLERLVTVYLETGGVPLEDLTWYRAFAGYRLACITAFNVYLHETGRRVDPAWAVIGDAFESMLTRAEELLD